jgi:signal transduction histidine kinase
MKSGKDVLQTYLDRAEKVSAAIRAGAQEALAISQAIKRNRIPLDGYRSVLLECLNGKGQVVAHSEYDQFRETLATLSGGLDWGAAFICVPVAVQEKVLGVMISDNRFLPSEQQTDFDESGLQTYASILAISLESERLQKSVAAEIAHDFNRQATQLSSLISCLHYEIKKDPDVSDIFRNSKAGDYFRQIVDKQNDLITFTKDFQAFGKPILLDRSKIQLRNFVEQQISRFMFAADSRIHYKTYHDEVTLDIDAGLIGRAIDALLNNAKQAVSENQVSHPCITVTTAIEADSRGGPVAVVSIADNGPGVRQEEKEKIFRPFFTKRALLGGGGLGLSSARRYVEAHGGTLLEVGTFGQGAVFVMRLPAVAAIGRET